MKIGLIVPGFSANADDWCIPALRNLVQRLATTDDVRVLALRYPYRAGGYDVFGARVHAVGGGSRRGLGSAETWWRAISALVDEHRRRRFDVLHAFWATESGALAVLAGRALRIPTVVSLAGGELVGLRDVGYGGQLVRSERLKVSLALHLASVVTAGSEYLLDLARPWIGSRPPDQRRRAPLGVDVQRFRPASCRPPGGAWSIVQVASLSPVKDQRTLLRAVARLIRREIEITLDVAGTGPLEPDLRALAQDLGIVQSVRFRGEIRHDLLPGLYHHGDVFTLSSRHEAQCLAALEAGACGLPIVGTAVGVIPELAPDAALGVPVGDDGTLADAIAEVVADPARRLRMAEAARARVESSFSLECCVDRFRSIYARCCRG